MTVGYPSLHLAIPHRENQCTPLDEQEFLSDQLANFHIVDQALPLTAVVPGVAGPLFPQK